MMGGGSFVTKDQNEDTSFPLPEKDKISEFLTNGKLIHLYPNHNVSGDSLATKIIFDSNIRIRLICHSVTCNYFVKGAPIDFLKEKAKKEENIETDPATVVGLLMVEWFKVRHSDVGQCPHDPLTIHEAVFGGEKSPLKYVRGNFVFHEWAAYSTFIPNNDGPHFMAVETIPNNSFLKQLGDSLMIEDYHN